MTTDQKPAQLEATIEIDAPPAQVRALISDPRRIAAFSPQVVKTFVRGSGPVTKGTKFFNINHRGPVFWPTQAMVVRCEPHSTSRSGSRRTTRSGRSRSSRPPTAAPGWSTAGDAEGHLAALLEVDGHRHGRRTQVHR